jgi:cell division protein FtsL
MIKEKVMTKTETKTVKFTKSDKIKFSILVSTILTVSLSIVYNIFHHGIHCSF